MANLLLLFLLALCFVRRYGTRLTYSPRQGGKVRWWRGTALWSRLPISLPNRASALVWLNLRQSVPLAACGLLLAALLTILQVAEYGHSENFRSQLPSSTWFIGILWGAVVGSGVFAAELQPGLSSFWRSRPMTVGAWFWCKFFTGLLAVLAVLDGTTILVSWGTPIGHTSGLSLTYIACMPLLHATLYALAVLGACWLRRPVVGAIVATTLFFIGIPLVESIIGSSYEPISIHNALLGDEMEGNLNLMSHNYPLVYGLLAAVFALSAWLASRVIREPEPRGLFVRHRRASAAA